MAKKQKWLIMPKVHSKFNDQQLQDTLIDKATDYLSSAKREAPAFIFLSGQFFDVKGFAYSALRAWKGAAKPSDSGRRPLLEATFASLSVYLSSLLSLQSDFYFAYDEFGFGVGTLVSFCPSPCRTGWPVAEITIWVSLVAGLLAAILLGIQIWRGSSQESTDHLQTEAA